MIGAHAGGFNIDTFGVSMIGNYDVTRPSAAAVDAVAKVFAWKLAQFHRDPQGSTSLTSAGGGTARYPAGKTMTFPVIMGHRNTGFTACPGKYLYAYLPRSAPSHPADAGRADQPDPAENHCAARICTDHHGPGAAQTELAAGRDRTL